MQALCSSINRFASKQQTSQQWHCQCRGNNLMHVPAPGIHGPGLQLARPRTLLEMSHACSHRAMHRRSVAKPLGLFHYSSCRCTRQHEAGRLPSMHASLCTSLRMHVPAKCKPIPIPQSMVRQCKRAVAVQKQISISLEDKFVCFDPLFFAVFVWQDGQPQEQPARPRGAGTISCDRQPGYIQEWRHGCMLSPVAWVVLTCSRPAQGRWR